MEITNIKDWREWQKKSEAGEVCGIFGCPQPVKLNCPRCGNHYCEEHILVHFHKTGKSIGW